MRKFNVRGSPAPLVLTLKSGPPDKDRPCLEKFPPLAGRLAMEVPVFFLSHGVLSDQVDHLEQGNALENYLSGNQVNPFMVLLHHSLTRDSQKRLVSEYLNLAEKVSSRFSLRPWLILGFWALSDFGSNGVVDRAKLSPYLAECPHICVNACCRLQDVAKLSQILNGELAYPCEQPKGQRSTVTN